MYLCGAKIEISYIDNNKMKRIVNLLISSVLAGVCIGLGGYVNLVVGGVTGAVMFSFGLLSVVHYGLALYTGKSGFFTNTTELVDLLYIIAGNFVGCWLVSLIFDYASPQYIESAQKVVNVIAGKSLMAVFVLAIPCGFIMSTAVKFAREGRYLPLLFGVPLFIVCGFRHSIADIFYYWAASDFLFLPWLMAILGNFVGCNVHRALEIAKEKK